MLIAARNAFMTRRLPYDAELEFLESTGTQWIDTGVSISDASLADVTWNVEVVSYNDGCMGAFGIGSYASMYFNLYVHKFYMRNMRTSGGSFTGVSGFNTVRFSGGNSYLNGTAVETEIPLKIKPVPTMYLFAYNRNGTTAGFCKARVSSFIVKENGVLLHDFIPVRKDGVGYMYDRVSGKLFGNAGTGDFALGPDVVPVEYLQADGNSKLYSPISLNSSNLAAGVEIRMDAAIPNPGNVNGILCQAGGYYVSPWAIATKSNSPGTCLLYSYGKFSREFTGLSNRTTMVVEVDATTVYLTVGSTRSGGTYNTTYQYGNQLVIFGYDGTGSDGSTLPAPAGTRLYAYKIYVRNVLVADAIPIRVGTGSTWEGAMMDVLTRRIYRNRGTGAFLYGADKN